MDLAIELGYAGALLLVLGALGIGIALQFIGQPAYGPGWIIAGVAALAGGFVASEWIVGLRAFAPVWDGLALVPATIGIVVAGVAVDAVARFWTHGTYVPTAA